MRTSIILILLIASSIVNSLPSIDMVSPVNDYPYKNHKLHSGFLDINGGARQLHYVLAESQNDPEKDPLIVWSNGGPGCSSMMGFLVENGPMVFEDGDDKVRVNPYAWNAKANMLYFELPYGVGYSEPKINEDLSGSDTKTGNTMLEALISFYSKFPTLRSNSFYITGESYAGIYVPHFAKAILNYNSTAKIFKINLVGFMINNAMANWPKEKDGRYAVDFAFDRDLVSPEIKSKFYASKCHETPKSIPCQDIINLVNNKINSIFSTNIYGYCFKESNEDTECNGSYGLIKFLNRDDVRKMLNIKSNSKWNDCSSEVKRQYQFGEGSYNLYPELINAGLKIVILSGDTDSYVSPNSLSAWITDLNLQKDLNPVEAWSVEKGIFSGYKLKYNGLTLVTIANGGHQVGQYKRKESQTLLHELLTPSPSINK